MVQWRAPATNWCSLLSRLRPALLPLPYSAVSLWTCCPVPAFPCRCTDAGGLGGFSQCRTGCPRPLCSVPYLLLPLLAAAQVLVGAHAVLANGGVVCPVGMHMVALAAKRHSIPFVVLVGLHKLSPLFPTDPDLLYNGEARGRKGVGRGRLLPCRLVMVSKSVG